MSQTLQLKAQPRTAVGKKVKALRREGFVTGTIYSQSKESYHIQLPYREAMLMFHEAGKNHLVEITIEGEGKRLALIERGDHEPVKRTLLHIAFHEVKRGEKVTAEVPVELIGESPAERAHLMIIEVTQTVEVTAEADQLPDHFELDKASLVEDGDSLTVADIKTGKGIEIMTPEDTVIARVETPRAQVESETEAEETATEAAKTE